MFTASKRENNYWSVGYALLKDYITVVDNKNHLISIYDKNKEKIEHKAKVITCIKMELLFIIGGLFLEIWVIMYKKSY
jgi:hypothetical protein